MSGDRLAHIEAQARDFHDTEFLGEHGLPAGVLYDCASALADDVLALVEIAKAAQRWAEAKNSDEIMYRARRLRQALARLDSGAAE